MEERFRDQIIGDITLEYFSGRLAKGWKLAAIEWVREEPATRASPVPTRSGFVSSGTELPYGLQFGAEGRSLEENPLEMTVLTLILEQIVREKRITEIAGQLNEKGFQRRDGTPWTPPAVFDLLPRLIEVSPALLKSPAWEQRRAGHSPA